MKKQYWILLSVCIILIIALPIIIYNNMTPSTVRDNLSYTPNVWDTIFDFFRLWAPIGVPLITLVGIFIALFIGLRTHRQSRDITERDRKERLRTEITQWASEVSELTVAIINSHFRMRHMQYDTPEHREALIELANQYERVRTKGIVATRIALDDFKETLHPKAIDTFEILLIRCDEIMRNLTAGRPAISEVNEEELRRELSEEDTTTLGTITTAWSRQSFLLNRFTDKVAVAAHGVIEEAAKLQL